MVAKDKAMLIKVQALILERLGWIQLWGRNWLDLKLVLLKDEEYNITTIRSILKLNSSLGQRGLFVNL